MEDHTLFADGTKVFIVEDDMFLGSLISKKFSEQKCVVTLANKGDEATKRVSDTMPHIIPFKPDLILLDEFINNNPGHRLCKKIKQVETLKGIPVIILSNLSSEEDIRKALSLGAAEFMIKATSALDQIVRKTSQILKGVKS